MAVSIKEKLAEILEERLYDRGVIVDYEGKQIPMHQLDSYIKGEYVNKYLLLETFCKMLMRDKIKLSFNCSTEDKDYKYFKKLMEDIKELEE